jgi:hypothetical protein
MPFQETCRMEERIEMLRDYDSGNWSVSAPGVPATHKRCRGKSRSGSG